MMIITAWDEGLSDNLGGGEVYKVDIIMIKSSSDKVIEW